MVSVIRRQQNKGEHVKNTVKRMLEHRPGRTDVDATRKSSPPSAAGFRSHRLSASGYARDDSTASFHQKKIMPLATLTLLPTSNPQADPISSVHAPGVDRYEEPSEEKPGMRGRHALERDIAANLLIKSPDWRINLPMVCPPAFLEPARGSNHRVAGTGELWASSRHTATR